MYHRFVYSCLSTTAKFIIFLLLLSFYLFIYLFFFLLFFPFSFAPLSLFVKWNEVYECVNIPHCKYCIYAKFKKSLTNRDMVKFKIYWGMGLVMLSYLKQMHRSIKLQKKKKKVLNTILINQHSWRPSQSGVTISFENDKSKRAISPDPTI